MNVVANPTPVAGEVETAKPKIVATRQPPAIANLKPPMVIFIAIDKTGSAKSSKIPNLMIDQVISLAQAVAKVDRCDCNEKDGVAEYKYDKRSK